ncbi:hypothetical protein J7I98_11760 [Streptomyces sp. ISL-98]|uniref:hypothetical protein n=1 Tax=Streptomyces sp. ISL-98 TaxID=2819192 RepID=UPI001BE5ECDB|nr:hypothetical protein [Streptomyces sp. ISL-98]MBT2506560.1 hypothetical protein [Streptomyces sp. ISL-98]
MNDDGASSALLLVLLVLLIGGITTYVAFINPLLGVAIVVGVVVAAFAYQLLKGGK